MNVNEQSKTKIFTQAVDFLYTNDQVNDNYYSYDGLDMQILDKILDKSNYSIIEEDINDNSTLGGLSEADSKHKYSIDSNKTGDTFTIKAFNIEEKKKISDILSINWKNNLQILQKQMTNRINKNNFLEGNKMSVRKMTYDTSSSKVLKNNHGFSN